MDAACSSFSFKTRTPAFFSGKSIFQQIFLRKIYQYHFILTLFFSFKDRIERRNWYQVLHSTSTPAHALNITSAYPAAIMETPTILYSDQESISSSGTESYNPRKRLKVVTAGFNHNSSTMSSSVRNTSRHVMSPRAMSHLGNLGERELDQSLDQQEKRKSRRRSAIDFLKNFKSKFEILKPTGKSTRKQNKRLSIN